MFLGWMIPLLVLLPNLLVIFRPPVDAPLELTDQNYKMMEIIERVGQAGCLIIPIFYPIPNPDRYSVLSLVVMAGALVIDYAGWLRYALGGHTYRLLFAPLLGLHLPLAVAPFVYFLGASAFLVSWPLALAALLLATGHLYVSRRNWQNAEQNTERNAGINA